MTQCEAILNYIHRHGGITPAEAFTELDCISLGQRIFDLRKDGYVFVETWQTYRTKAGVAKQVKRFSLPAAQTEMRLLPLICNKEFIYENFCSLPKGHVEPCDNRFCDNPPNTTLCNKKGKA